MPRTLVLSARAYAARPRNLALAAVVALTLGCSFDPPPDVPASYRVSGTVDGMWDGAAIVLRLETLDDEEITSVAANGEFAFELLVDENTSFSVTVDEQPSEHECEVVGGAGTATSDITNIEVHCVGPSVDVALSAPLAWTFVADQASYALEASVATQQTDVIVTAPVATSITLDGAALTSGMPSPPVALGLGSTELTIEIQAGELSRSYSISIDRGAAVLEQFLYAKASNTQSADEFGRAIALSGDTLVVAATKEDSGSTGSNDDESNNNAADSGAVYVFRRSGSTWTQEAYLKASNTEAGDEFGTSVAIDGDLIAVGAPLEDSPSTGVNNNQTANTAGNAGAVYVFHRTGSTWAQEAYVKASNTEATDGFGRHLALSGNTLVVGASNEDSAATGINGSQSSNTATTSGAVYVFRRSGTTWSQEAYVKASNTDADDRFGWSLDIDGDVMVVGAVGESSNATNVGGDQINDAAPFAGAVYVFRRTGTTWVQEAYVKASNPESMDLFGNDVAISGDVLAVGAPIESSDSTGVGGSGTNNNAVGAGAVYLYRRIDGTWTPEAYVKASNTEANDKFGEVLALDRDVLVVGANSEASSATGIDGNQSSNAASSAGAAYVFRFDGASWGQAAYVKASNADAGDIFASSVAVSADTIAVGAPYEDSNTAELGGDETNDAAESAGAVYVFR